MLVRGKKSFCGATRKEVKGQNPDWRWPFHEEV
jgi:hypothetical protein